MLGRNGKCGGALERPLGQKVEDHMADYDDRYLGGQ